MRLSIIISNRNDTSMLAVTLRSCIEELKAVSGGGEVVIVDNSDERIWNLIPSLIPSGFIDDGRVQLIRQDYPCLFTARETGIRRAKGNYIACVDSHMIIGYNMFKDMVDFMNRHRDDERLGFGHAPINWAHQHESKSKHDRDVSECELGNWNKQYDYERKITWKGMPWICRRRWFNDKLGGYGALSKNKLSWGGGDILLGTKTWLLGYENWAIPTNPAIHLGPFPNVDGKEGNKYRVYSKSGQYPAVTGYLVALYSLGGMDAIKRNTKAIKKNFPWFNIQKYIPVARKLARGERKRLEVEGKMTYQEYLKNKPWEDNLD